MSLRYDELYKVLDLIIEESIEEAQGHACEGCTFCDDIGCEKVYCPVMNDDPDITQCDIQDEVNTMIKEWNALLDAVEFCFGKRGRGEVIAKKDEIIYKQKLEAMEDSCNKE